MHNVTFKGNEVIFKQGTYASTMYEVTSGSVGVFAAYGTEDENRLAVFGPGEYFGEMGIVECYPRTATAVALSPNTEVVEFDAKDFSGFYQQQPDKVLAIMRQLSARLRETNKKYEEACNTVYEAIEAEKAGKKRSRSIRSRLSSMLRGLR